MPLLGWVLLEITVCRCCGVLLEITVCHFCGVYFLRIQFYLPVLRWVLLELSVCSFRGGCCLRLQCVAAFIGASRDYSVFMLWGAAACDYRMPVLGVSVLLMCNNMSGLCRVGGTRLQVIAHLHCNSG